jgi:hypothetical protein
MLVLAGCAATMSYRTSSSIKEQQATAMKAEIELKREREIRSRTEVDKERLLMREPTGSGPTPSPAPTETKPIVEKPIIIEKIKTISEKLFSASLAFVMVDKANIENTIKAQLLIDPNSKVENLEKQLTVKGKTTTGNIRVSNVVQAKLIAPDFDVTKITEEEQILSDDKPTEWEWSLKPKKAGTYEVNLSVTAIIDGHKHHLKSFEKTLVIEITKEQIFMDWFEENYKWLVTTLLIPLIGFLFKEKFKKLFAKIIN